MIPFVVLIDLDGTIVGDVTSLLNEWSLERAVKNMATPITSNISNSNSSSSSSAFQRNFRAGLKSGLLRPGFSEFVHSALSRHGVELFVATMSSRDWAPVVIQNVEAIVGKKFNRPLLTREYFESSVPRDMKSLAKVRQHVFNRLRKKYGDLKFVEQLDGRMMLIDNTDILVEKEYWIPCSTYDYLPCIDILRLIDPATLQANFQHIKSEMMRMGALARGSSTGAAAPAEDSVASYHAFLSQHYQRLARQLAMHAQSNSAFTKDTFWTRCAQTLLPPLFKSLHGAAPGIPHSLAAILRAVNNSVRSHHPRRQQQGGACQGSLGNRVKYPISRGMVTGRLRAANVTESPTLRVPWHATTMA